MEEFKKRNDLYVVRKRYADRPEYYFTIAQLTPGLSETKNRIPYDTALGCMVTDSCSAGCLILVKGDKMGFMTVRKYYGIDSPRYFSPDNPFIYDTVEFITCDKWQENAADGVNKGCLLLQKDGKWGAVEVYQESYPYRPYQHIIPIEYSREEVLNQIRNSDSGLEPLLINWNLWDIYRWY